MNDKTASEPTSADYRQCQRCLRPIAGSFVVRGLLYYHVECSISDADRLTVANAEIASLAARVQEQADAMKLAAALHDETIKNHAAEIERLTKERDDARRALVTAEDLLSQCGPPEPEMGPEPIRLDHMSQQMAAARAAIAKEEK